MVLIKGESSKKVPLTSEVPQGSLFGPLLFTIYTLRLGDLIRTSYDMNFHLYAGGAQLYMIFTPTATEHCIEAGLLRTRDTCIDVV